MLLSCSFGNGHPSVIQHGFEPCSADSYQSLLGGGCSNSPRYPPGSLGAVLACRGLAEAGDSLRLDGVPDLDGGSKSGPLLVPEMPVGYEDQIKREQVSLERNITSMLGLYGARCGTVKRLASVSDTRRRMYTRLHSVMVGK